MAQVNLSGTVVCKQGDPAVTLKTLGNDYTIAEFSIRDTEYFYYKGDDKPGQFYKVQVGGKAAESGSLLPWAAEVVASHSARVRKRGCAGGGWAAFS